MRIVVAGADGFLGGHLLDELARRDAHVLALVTPDASTPPQFPSDAEVVEVDPLDLDALRPIVRGADAVINAVQLITPGRTDEQYDDVNIGGATTLLDACADTDVRAFIHLSSTTMYGASMPHWPVNESWAFRPATTVDQSRAMAERAARTYRRRVPLIIARFARAFGPRDEGVVHHLLQHFLDQRRPRLPAGGRAPVSLAYAPDMGRAIWGLLDHVDACIDRTFHIKSFDTDWRTIVVEVQRLVHRRADVQSIPYRVALVARACGLGDWLLRAPPDVGDYLTLTGRAHLVDDSRLRVTTGFTPVFGVRAALRQTLEWMSEERPDIRL